MNVKKDKLYQDIKVKMEKYGQQQLLRHYEELDEEEQLYLLKQLDAIPFQKINAMYLNRGKKENAVGITEPMEVMKLEESKKYETLFRETGMEAVRNGQVAVVLLAGGQATRLGINGPKGMFDIGITKHLYLFEVIIQKLLMTAQETSTYVDLYIMTNEKDENEVREFFDRHDYFGYPEAHMILFHQSMLPKLLFDGKMILEDKGCVAQAPSGNGAWIEALQNQYLLEKMKLDGVQFINLLSIDNPLYNIIDFTFLGALILREAQMGVQVVEKNSPYEKVGVICKRNGKPAVKEYYEMTKQEQEARNDKNELCYRYGVILNYLFRFDECYKTEVSFLPVHFAEKKMSYITEDGTASYPDKENGYVMERLALDMIQKHERVLAFEVDRESNFAPIKNKTGVDSVDSARKLLVKNGYQL